MPISVTCRDGTHEISDLFIESSDVLRDLLIASHGDSFVLKTLGGYSVLVDHMLIIETMLKDTTGIFTMDKFYITCYHNPVGFGKLYGARDLATCLVICNFFNLERLMSCVSIIYHIFKGDKKALHLSDEILEHINKAVNTKYTGDFYHFIMLYQTPEYIKDIIDASYNMWRFAVRCNGYYVVFMPPAMVDQRIILEIIKGGCYLKYTVELYPQYFNADLYELYLDNHGQLKDIPDKDITLDLVHRAFLNLPHHKTFSDITDIPDRLLTQELVDTIWDSGKYTKHLFTIPEHLTSYKMCMDALKYKRVESYTTLWTYIPSVCITKQIICYTVALIRRKEMKIKNRTLPRQWHHYPENSTLFEIERIPKHLLDDSNICKMLSSITGRIFDHMPKYLITLGFCIECIKTYDDYERLIYHIPQYICKHIEFAQQMKKLFPTLVSIKENRIKYHLEYKDEDDYWYDYD